MSYLGAVIIATKQIREHNEAESAVHTAALTAACGDPGIGATLVDADRMENHGLEAALTESNRVYEVELAIIAESARLGRKVTEAEAAALNAASHATAYPPAAPGLLARLRGKREP